jgi:SAM-dependent methyltransferase
MTRGAIGDIVREASVPVHLLEIGAGSGHFLKPLLADPHVPLAGVVATEYNPAAVVQMRRLGISASGRDLDELVSAESDRGRFTIICMFQVLHMMDGLEHNLECLKQLLAPEGHLFVSVPTGSMTDLQERLTGYAEMPPGLLTRWYDTSFDAAAARWGFRIERRVVAPRRFREVWRFAVMRTRSGSIARRLAGVGGDFPRGAMRRAMATIFVPSTMAHWRILEGSTQWVHLRPVPESGVRDQA